MQTGAAASYQSQSQHRDCDSSFPHGWRTDFMKQLHTFAVCAYKESPYLEDCIQSLRAQTVKSNILIATSTPNDYIRSIAEKYDIPLIVNPGKVVLRRTGILPTPIRTANMSRSRTRMMSMTRRIWRRR